MLNKDLDLRKLNKAYIKAQESLISLAIEIERTFKPGTFLTHSKTNESITVTGSIPTNINTVPDIMKIEVATGSGNRVNLSFTDLLEWEIWTKNH